MHSQKISNKDVLFEDNHLIAINKQAGILVQGDKSGDPPLAESLALYLKNKYDKPGNVFTGVIHRLDRPVIGLVLVAKTSKGLARMNETFKERKISKSYYCLVEGRVNDLKGTLESFLKKNGAKNKSFSSKKESSGYKKAILKYEVIRHLDNFSLLKVQPKTGRHHQIRVQLSAFGYPIKGDLKYGAKRSNEDASICLHAYSLEFLHPIQKTKMSIVAPLHSRDSWPGVVLD